MNKEAEKVMEREREEAQERRAKKIAGEVTADFERRREERRSVESGWLLNLNFYSGNQYCDVSPFGGLIEEDKQFYWQSRRVFNRIAPVVDARLAKLEKLRPILSVRAFSDEDGDLKAAKLATGILTYVRERVGLDEVVSKATTWSEICGCAFYKLVWNEQGGRQVAVDEQGNAVFEGEIAVSALSPFEIYPDRLDVESIEELASIIHAKTVSVDYVFEKFGVEVQGDAKENTPVYSEPSAGRLPTASAGGNVAPISQGVVLIERYTRPTVTCPKGRLEIVAGGKLLFEGDLPFKIGEGCERAFPFVKQDCLKLPASFFGTSVVDRLIPVQRAYNSVRNRKHEFFNRLSLGVLTVEDGSVDTDELAEEGLLPGKILVYRQGGKAPQMLDCGNIPSEFAEEEAWLEKEFSKISGVSEVTESSTPTRVTSATGLQLLLSQDEARMSATLTGIDAAIKEIGRQALRLYKQYAGSARLMTLTGENKKTQTYYFNAADLEVGDLQFDTENAVTPEEKKETLLQLYEAGILSDEHGNLTTENKQRILEAFGFGSYENAKDITALHIEKADEENLELLTKEVTPDEYDDHALHITAHTRFLLSAEFKNRKDKEGLKKVYLAHIHAHEKLKKEKGGLV